MWMKELFFNPPFQFLRSSVLGISFTEGAGGAGREGGKMGEREVMMEWKEQMDTHYMLVHFL